MAMKILILGASGMLGHRLLGSLSAQGNDVVGTVRGDDTTSATIKIVPAARLIGGISVEQDGAVEAVLDQVKPDVVVNCIGVVKQRAAAKDPLISLPVNALFPHQLAQACAERGVRMIHFSTDCVFAGTNGPYTEASRPDPEDLYGRSKLSGEVNAPNVLTLRTSVIGHELGEGTGLLAWILRNRGERVSGYARALYTGVTTDYMARALLSLLTDFPALCGVWHLSADPISKYDLASLIDEIYNLGLTIDRDESYVRDRRLDSTALRNRAGIVPPSWREMVEEMHANYDRREVPETAAK